MATRRGLEPLTSSVTGWRTNQLYYRAKEANSSQTASLSKGVGGPSGTRTPDQPVMSRPL